MLRFDLNHTSDRIRLDVVRYNVMIAAQQDEVLKRTSVFIALILVKSLAPALGGANMANLADVCPTRKDYRMGAVRERTLIARQQEQSSHRFRGRREALGFFDHALDYAIRFVLRNCTNDGDRVHGRRPGIEPHRQRGKPADMAHGPEDPP